MGVGARDERAATVRSNARKGGVVAWEIGHNYVSSSDTRRRILAPPRQGCRFSQACSVIGGESRTFNATVALQRAGLGPVNAALGGMRDRVRSGGCGACYF